MLNVSCVRWLVTLLFVVWKLWSKWLLSDYYHLEQNQKLNWLRFDDITHKRWSDSDSRKSASYFTTLLWHILSAGTTMRVLLSFQTFNDPVKCLYCFTVNFLAELHLAVVLASMWSNNHSIPCILTPKDGSMSQFADMNQNPSKSEIDNRRWCDVWTKQPLKIFILLIPADIYHQYTLHIASHTWRFWWSFIFFRYNLTDCLFLVFRKEREQTWYYIEILKNCLCL